MSSPAAGRSFTVPVYPYPNLFHHLGTGIEPGFVCKTLWQVKDPSATNGYQSPPRGFPYPPPPFIALALLAPDLPITVVPPSIRDAEAIDLRALPAWGGVAVPDVFGMPCTIHLASVSFPEITPYFALFFDLWVLVPTSDPPSDRPPQILLGAQFLRRYRAKLHTDCENLIYQPLLRYPCGSIMY